MKTFKFSFYDVEHEGRLIVNHYCSNGGLYLGIECFTKDGEFEYWEPYCDVSTNLPFPLPENCIAIKKYDEGDKIYEILKELDLIKRQVREEKCGYGFFWIVEIDMDKLVDYCC